MVIIFIRTVIIFLTLLVVMRLMGKRQIGEMQPFEFVITLLIAELACIPTADVSIPLLYGLVAIVTLYLMHQAVCLLDLTCKPLKSVLSGSPSIVINKNGIDEKQLKKNDLDVSDLVEALRGAGYFSLDSVDYALYESNGNFSALPKSDAEESTSLPVVIVDEGKFDGKNLALTGKSKDYFRDVLKERGCKNEKQALVLTVDGNGKCYLQKKKQKYEVFSLDWKEALW